MIDYDGRKVNIHRYYVDLTGPISKVKTTIAVMATSMLDAILAVYEAKAGSACDLTAIRVADSSRLDMLITKAVRGEINANAT